MKVLIELIEESYYLYPWVESDSYREKMANLRDYIFDRGNTTQYDWGGHIEPEMIKVWANMCDESRVVALYYASKLAGIANDFAE